MNQTIILEKLKLQFSYLLISERTLFNRDHIRLSIHTYTEVVFLLMDCMYMETCSVCIEISQTITLLVFQNGAPILLYIIASFFCTNYKVWLDIKGSPEYCTADIILHRNCRLNPALCRVVLRDNCRNEWVALPSLLLQDITLRIYSVVPCEIG